MQFTVVVVETDLALNAGDPSFDAKKVDSLADTVTNTIADKDYAADMIRLVETED